MIGTYIIGKFQLPETTTWATFDVDRALPGLRYDESTPAICEFSDGLVNGKTVADVLAIARQGIEDGKVYLSMSLSPEGELRIEGFVEADAAYDWIAPIAFVASATAVVGGTGEATFIPQGDDFTRVVIVEGKATVSMIDAQSVDEETFTRWFSPSEATIAAAYEAWRRAHP